MSHSSEVNFVRQQGFREAGAAACDCQFPALMFQPRIIGVGLVIALVLQSATLFLGLSGLLWWNVLLPARNPFDALYNARIARPQGFPPLPPAPPPRRFAQGMAATFMLAIGSALLFGWHLAAWIFEGLLIAAFAALIFGKFCLSSYLYHLIRRDSAFANRTLPWARS
ncbi:MAG: hypothetical protein A2091_00220 [Desulfuromonadales bacterium GWD2_61_12]|nr:MAG: hypothetical protein A2091_00220 [Desulfuromonadales bacterium GWD2_61_12]